MNRSAFWTKATIALAYVGAAVIIGFALYGVATLIARSLTARDGERAAGAVSPFVQGAASVVGEKAKEALKKTPDAKLEKDSEDISRKLYPIAKGALKGHLEAILNDTNRADVPEKMYQAGKDVSEKVVRPFSKGLAEGTGKVLQDVDKTLQGVRSFQENNKDLLDAVTKGLEALHKAARENPGLFPPPPPPLPLPFVGNVPSTSATAPPQPNAPDTAKSTPPDQDR